MDRRQQEIQDWEVEQARMKGQADRLRSLEEAEKAADADAAKRAAEAALERAAAQKAEEEKGATDNFDPAKPVEGRQPTKAPFASAPASKSDQVGANGPGATTPTPPPRPKARPTQGDPAPGLY
jgi:hypothetical protein